jgi:putative pyruvate formate lyase activating enzyme
VVWNSGGYERPETLALLDGIVDIYLPDLKCWTPEAGELLASAPDYARVARRAIREMARQVGPLVLDASGAAVRGLIVRHLVLPGGLSSTDRVIRFVEEELPPGTALSLMGQYVPAGRAVGHPLLGRRPTRREYEDACALLSRSDVRRGWTQDIDGDGASSR